MQFTLIQQNDTHGCLEFHNELFWSSNGPILKKVGGFARASQYVKNIRKKNDHVLFLDRKSTRLNSSHVKISYAVFCLKKKKHIHDPPLLHEIPLPQER